MKINGTDTYWNPILETLPPIKLRALQFKKFKRMVEWAYENSRLYRRRYDEEGFKPEELQRWEDIYKVPIIQKEDFRNAQIREPWPYGESLSVPLEDVARFHQTTGATGQPVYMPDTWADWEVRTECWAYALWAAGFRNTDRVFIPFGYNVYMGSWSGHYACEKLGCEVVPGGILNTEERLLKMKELRVNAFMATPTYVLKMADVCRNKLNIDPREMGIDKILCSGEPGASVPTTKKLLEDAWNARVFDFVAATEVGGWAYECAHQPGGLHANEAFFLTELMDIDTGDPIEELHMPGKVVITTLDRFGHPCIRFDSKDVGMWDKPCGCGRSFRILKGGVHGRVDHITKVKGVLFSPIAVDEVVRTIPELADDYELIVTKEGPIDELILKVEMQPEATADQEAVKSKLSRELRLRTTLHFEIEFHPFGTLERPHIKVHRFKDLRAH